MFVVEEDWWHGWREKQVGLLIQEESLWNLG